MLSTVIIYLTYALLIIFPLGQLTRIQIAPEVNLYWQDVLIIAILATWLISKIINKEKFFLPKLTKPILAFYLVLGFSWLMAVSLHPLKEILVSFLYLARLISYAGIYLIVYNLVKQNNNLKKKISDLLLLAGVVSAIFGLLQYIFMPDIRPLNVLGWDPHYFRVVGTFLDPGYLGMILVLTLVLLIGKIWQIRDIRLIWLLRGIFGLVYFALALTYSRSAYLAYFVSMALIAWYKKSIKFFLIILITGIITLKLLPRPGGEGVRLERESTIWARFNNWRQALTIAFDYPLFGVGFNNYRYAQRDYGFLNKKNWQETHSGAGTDSSLLFILATSGIIGVISLISLIEQIVKVNIKYVVVMASLLGLLIHSIFLNSLFYPWIMVWIWILLALYLKDLKEVKGD